MAALKKIRSTCVSLEVEDRHLRLDDLSGCNRGRRSAGDEEEGGGGGAVRTRVIVATSDTEERNAEYQSQSVVLWQNTEGTFRADGGQRRLQSRALQEQN